MKPHIDWKKISCHPVCTASTVLKQKLAQKEELKSIHAFPENRDYLLNVLRC